MIKKLYLNARSVKWELLVTFIISGCIIISVLWIGLLYGDDWLNGFNWWTYGMLTVLIVSTFTGYIAGLRLQRRLDVLHEGMMQVSKGNGSYRIKENDEDASFSRLYDDFNKMVSTMEHKIKVLQKLTEQQDYERERVSETIVQEERKRLARDLHDTVSQQLFAMHMASSSLPKMMELDPERGKAVIEQLIGISHTAQRQMRGLIAQLRPIELDGKTIVEALHYWFPDYCNQNGLQGKLDLQVNDSLSDAKEHQLFLLIQEAMANVVKHAKARQVTLTLQEEDNRIMLHVADDGVGFNRNAVSNGGSYGLSTMNERVDKLGGHMELISTPGAGTTIRVLIPLFEDKEDSDASEREEANQDEEGGTMNGTEDEHLSRG
ncbi:sensor histidine kinase [Paenibacillus sp. 1001270B_150601_E10]|uniref:sensor histidine kinase n=1 Tax=Paenibacillus sp. 1001270B_150601_E10 TaxID=2787079 RepID=UPI0018A05D5D|nr:sensor histidine kinase [Paenibacillus sp. 1001270B_150601_E10]